MLLALPYNVQSYAEAFIMANRVLCVRPVKNLSQRESFIPETIYEYEPMLSEPQGVVGYLMHLDNKYMGVIESDQFNSNFLRTTLTQDEYQMMDDNMGVIVWC
jgi:carbamoylphosphate synthase large subunit